MNNEERVLETISKPMIQRLPNYLNYLIEKKKDGFISISSTVIASELKLNPVQIRKDLAKTGAVGKPKTGFDIDELIQKINEMLGYNNTTDAILVGAGQLGRTLLFYGGFAKYGLNIVSAFDTDDRLYDIEICEKKILPVEKMKEIIKRLKIRIGIITVPADYAQQACDMLIESGILAIWNFAPVHLNVPENILVQNENMAASLALLSKHLQEKI